MSHSDSPNGTVSFWNNNYSSWWFSLEQPVKTQKREISTGSKLYKLGLDIKLAYILCEINVDG